MIRLGINVVQADTLYDYAEALDTFYQEEMEMSAENDDAVIVSKLLWSGVQEYTVFSVFKVVEEEWN